MLLNMVLNAPAWNLGEAAQVTDRVWMKNQKVGQHAHGKRGSFTLQVKACSLLEARMTQHSALSSPSARTQMDSAMC